MNKEEIDRLIRAGFTIASSDLDELRQAADHARNAADKLDVDTTDEEHLAADLSLIATLCASAEMLDLIYTYRLTQSFKKKIDPIDLDGSDDHHGGQHR